MTRRPTLLALLVLAGCGARRGAESPPAPPPAPAGVAVDAAGPTSPAGAAQLLARRVERIEIRPGSLELTVGDVAPVEAVIPLDARGDPVAGVMMEWSASGVAAAFDPEAASIEGFAAGKTTFTFRVPRPEADGGAVEATLEVVVHPLPVSRIAIDAPGPDESLLAGTRRLVSATAFSARGRREDATITWASSDPGVLEVIHDATILAGHPGSAILTAASEGVESSVELRVVENPVRRLRVVPDRAELAAGEVIRFSATALDGRGRPVPVDVEWTAAGLGGATAAAEMASDGAFVADEPGLYRVVATVGSLSSVADVKVGRRPPRRPVKLVAHGVVPPEAGSTTDLWVFEGADGRDYAYTGTMSAATMYAWDVTDPAHPTITDSVKADGRRVNDVKVNEDATLAIITSEQASNRRNGITILDIADPAHPTIVSHFTENLTGGVHNVWIDGDLVYAVNDGTRDVHIIDISDPARPRNVGRWGLERPDKYLHDVMVKDGLAYLSYWNDGLVILDVGAGLRGGTPTDPAFVSQFRYRYAVGPDSAGNTHHAIRYKDYVFLGDEVLSCRYCAETGPKGYVHVLDVTDIERPVEIARYGVPGAGPHNLWAEDDRLYVAHYQGGLRVVDISGELRGDLYRQGRELGVFMTEDAQGTVPHSTMAWGPQPYKGDIYVSDMHSGLWILHLQEPDPGLAP
ncbi:MAG: LVIVD repeat-containing protein [Gemmatimonadota bacterium]